MLILKIRASNNIYIYHFS